MDWNVFDQGDGNYHILAMGPINYEELQKQYTWLCNREVAWQECAERPPDELLGLLNMLGDMVVSIGRHIRENDDEEAN